MTLTVRDLQNLRFSALEGAKDEWAQIARRLGGYCDRVDAHMLRPLSHDWSGEAADKARKRMTRLSDNFQFSSQECALVETTLDGAITELRAQQKLLHQVLDEATGKGYRVAPTGEVMYADEGDIPTGDPDAGVPAKEQERLSLESDIFDALRGAEEIDARYRLALAQLRVGRGLSVNGLESGRDAAAISKIAGVAVGLDSAPAKGTDPKKVRDWWKGLSKEEQEEQMALNPSLIGNLDGIPAKTRDKANRVNLDRLIAMYPPGTPVSPTVARQREGFEAIKNRLEGDSGKEPEPLLLGIGPEGQGRAILSYGDPDTADNVAAYVPGLNTQLRDVGAEDGDRALHVWDSAQDASDGRKTTASIVWLGYDAPQADTDRLSDSDLSVADRERGQKGGAAFGQFLDGVQATHQGERPHVTAIGHSYGSFTVGQAAQREGGIPADDIILVGSPGTGAQRAEQLGVGADHVWAGAAESDLVTHAPSDFETLPGGAIAHLIDPHELHFGQDPASEEFGGRRFGVAEGDSPASHSNYFDGDKGGDSLANMGAIVAGRPEKVTFQGRR
ncbi:alpha/beta hydrolase [Streptomyces lydicus]|uniref:alpha/beta hydrolase n=1 Tax=Streptomyces lydicus TaxID=47763 RepID=UPI00286FE14A|nr:alpha/beta hydrolase [Streptomyces lydicus]